VIAVRQIQALLKIFQALLKISPFAAGLRSSPILRQRIVAES
jgi:hypothetical protein